MAFAYIYRDMQLLVRPFLLHKTKIFMIERENSDISL